MGWGLGRGARGTGCGAARARYSHFARASRVSARGGCVPGPAGRRNAAFAPEIRAYPPAPRRPAAGIAAAGGGGAGGATAGATRRARGPPRREDPSTGKGGKGRGRGVPEAAGVRGFAVGAGGVAAGEEGRRAALAMTDFNPPVAATRVSTTQATTPSLRGWGAAGALWLSTRSAT